MPGFFLPSESIYNKSNAFIKQILKRYGLNAKKSRLKQPGLLYVKLIAFLIKLRLSFR